MEMPIALIADDNEHNRNVFQIALENAGYTTLIACDGEDAINNLDKTAAVELVILDLQMPKMSGSEVLEMMRKSERWKDITVFVITANPYMLDPELQALADYVLVKPINIMQLKTLAERIKPSLLND